MRANLKKTCIHSGKYSLDSKLNIYVKMFVTMKKMTHLKVGPVGSNLKPSCVHFRRHSFDPICMKLNSSVHSRRHNFDPICMKLCQNVCHDEILDILKLDHVRSKSSSLDQILEKTFLHSKGLKVLFQSL